MSRTSRCTTVGLLLASLSLVTASREARAERKGTITTNPDGSLNRSKVLPDGRVLLYRQLREHGKFAAQRVGEELLDPLAQPVVDRHEELYPLSHYKVFRLSAKEMHQRFTSMAAHPEHAVFDVVRIGGGGGAWDDFRRAKAALGRKPHFLVMEESWQRAFNDHGYRAGRYFGWDLGWGAKVVRAGGMQSAGRALVSVELARPQDHWPGQAKYRLVTNRGEVLYTNQLLVETWDQSMKASSSAQVAARALALEKERASTSP